MLRVSLRIAAAVTLLVLGWIGGSARATRYDGGTFRVTVKAMSGATLSCEGCRFLTWPNGHAQPEQTVNVECAPGVICTSVFGAVAAPEKLKVIASR